MRIAFCTTCKGRVQHLERTLPQNLADNADYANAVFVVLDYGSPDHLLEYLLAKHKREIDSGRLVVYSSREPGPFRMSHAKNMAHRCAILEGADILVNMDADNWAAPGFASWIAEQYKGCGGKNDFFLWTNAKSVCGRARQGLAGRIAVHRNLFLKVGGYDERYQDWAPEDEDFKARIRRLGYEGCPIPDPFLYVIPHRDGLRFKEYPHAKPTPEIEAAAMKAIRGATNTIANFGNIGCGEVYRNFGPKPIALEPLPTRIFGVGMPKTATTSLHTALDILGYDSAHWTTPRWARNIWEELVTGNRSLTLERHYALCDLPIPFLFRELDIAYPGSKFILTLRDESSWLESCRKHWSRKHNPWRETWDDDAFSHRAHNLMYGRKEFDADIFLSRYRRHNAEVMEYFKRRPGDLLVMRRHRWQELCGFLRQPVPAVEYPRALVTKGSL